MDALLIYPRLGSTDEMVTDLPLSLLYAAADSVKRGYAVRILDLRVEKGDWRPLVAAALKEKPAMVGVSVMTGSPLRNAIDVSSFVRETSPTTPIVWGGPHVTVVPETLQDPYIDYLIRGYGSQTMASLLEHLTSGQGKLADIPGLSYKLDGQSIHTPRSNNFEILPWQDIPYHLIDVSSEKYFRKISGKKVFSIFSSIGCPYMCSFCVHPAVYAEINGPKWLPYEPEEVVGHMRYVKEQFGAEHIVFLDDTSFPNINRMRTLFEDIIAADLGLTLEFRGARVNEILKMDDEFLELMAKAGTRLLMVGGESGSDRVLKTMNKGITKAQILEANQKLASHPRIAPMYSFFYGSPGELYEDILESKDMILQMFEDNKNAYINVQGDWKPVPCTKMLDMAIEQYGYVPPKTTEEWAEVDSLDAAEKVVYPWYDKRLNNMIKLMQVASVVIDDKLIRESHGNSSLMFRMLRLLSTLYKPIVLFRLKHNLHQVMIEYDMWKLMMRLLFKRNSD